MELLTEDEIAAQLSGTPGWVREGTSITRRVTREDFRAAMLYAGAVAYPAEEANHHPDILIQWNQVTMTLSTIRLRPDRRDFGLADGSARSAERGTDTVPPPGWPPAPAGGLLAFRPRAAPRPRVAPPTGRRPLRLPRPSSGGWRPGPASGADALMRRTRSHGSRHGRQRPPTRVPLATHGSPVPPWRPPWDRLTVPERLVGLQVIHAVLVSITASYRIGRKVAQA
jgi:4a-hydroxytetrahydrobiopterin dehydratase